LLIVLAELVVVADSGKVHAFPNSLNQDGGEALNAVRENA